MLSRSSFVQQSSDHNQIPDPNLSNASAVTSSPGESAVRAKLDIFAIVLALIGFATALYLLIEHIRAKAIPGVQLSCDLNEKISCSTVLTSEYGEFIGIPLGAFGLSFWAGILAVAILPKVTQVTPRYHASWRLISASIGFITALALFYISYFVIKGICPGCSVTQATCLVYFIYAVVAFIKAQPSGSPSNPNAFVKLVSLVLALSVPPIIAGFIAPPIVADMIKGHRKVTPAEIPTPAPNETPFPADWLSISKSAYVGRGEDFRMGNDDARIVIHIFADPECPGCKQGSANLEAAIKTVGLDKTLLVYHMYPLDSSCNPGAGTVHPESCKLVLAARCAGLQGKFFEMLHWFYNNQQLNPGEKQPLYAPAGLAAQAEKFGCDKTRFSQCMEAKTEMPKILDDIERGTKMGLTGTPYIVINGRRFRGNHGDPAVITAYLQQLLSE